MSERDDLGFDSGTCINCGEYLTMEFADSDFCSDECEEAYYVVGERGIQFWES